MLCHGLQCKKRIGDSSISSRKISLRGGRYFLYGVYTALPFVLREYFVHFADQTTVLNVSSYEPRFMLLMGSLASAHVLCRKWVLLY